MQPNIWMYLFFSLLVITVIVVAYMDMRQSDQPLIYYKEKYEDLERRYTDLAGSHSYVLETVLKNDVDLRQYWPEFSNKTKEEYIEYLRREIVRMQLDIEHLNHDHKK